MFKTTILDLAKKPSGVTDYEVAKILDTQAIGPIAAVIASMLSNKELLKVPWKRDGRDVYVYNNDYDATEEVPTREYKKINKKDPLFYFIYVLLQNKNIAIRPQVVADIKKSKQSAPYFRTADKGVKIGILVLEGTDRYKLSIDAMQPGSIKIGEDHFLIKRTLLTKDKGIRLKKDEQFAINLLAKKLINSSSSVEDLEIKIDKLIKFLNI